MGLTPLEGLIMGTRSGDVDPAVVQYICNKENKTVDEVLNILNKKSGVLGISGVSSDFRDVTKAENEGNERAKAANEAFIYLRNQVHRCICCCYERCRCNCIYSRCW